MVNDEGEQQEHPSKTWPDVMIDAAVARSGYKILKMSHFGCTGRPTATDVVLEGEHQSGRAVCVFALKIR